MCGYSLSHFLSLSFWFFTQSLTLILIFRLFYTSPPQPSCSSFSLDILCARSSSILLFKHVLQYYFKNGLFKYGSRNHTYIRIYMLYYTIPRNTIEWILCLFTWRVSKGELAVIVRVNHHFMMHYSFSFSFSIHNSKQWNVKQRTTKEQF